MTLQDRDRQVVQTIAKFGQLTTGQVNELVFYGLASLTPCARSLRRLFNQGYLARVELRRVVGGRKGGAGQYVYQLGRRGYHLLYDGSYRPARAVDYHQLLLADSYIMVKRLERAGVLVIDGYTVEPDVLDGATVYHDMRLDVTRRDGQQYRLWLEVDMATEGRKQIRDKLVRYRNAMYLPDVQAWPVRPIVLWVACDAERDKELRWIINQGRSAEVLGRFLVTTLEQLPTVFLS